MQGSGKRKISRIGRSVIIPMSTANPKVITIVSGISPSLRKQDVRTGQPRCNICGRFGRGDGTLPCTYFDYSTMMYEHE